jgi:Uma2 family endonuclease
MATQIVVPVEEYLAGDYADRPAPEYRDGEVIERGMTTWEHSEAQGAFIAIFRTRFKGRNVFVLPELHVKLARAHYRVSDVAIYVGTKLAGRPDVPPLIDIEILSPDDKLTRILDKFEDLRAFGVKHLWLVDPIKRTFSVFDRHGLNVTDELTVPELDLRLSPADVFPAE